MSAVKRYPFAITRVARERRMENWANSRIAVIESHTNIAVAYAGTKAATGVVLKLESGPAVIKHKHDQYAEHDSKRQSFLRPARRQGGEDEILFLGNDGGCLQHRSQSSPYVNARLLE